tara:strand:- start:379 stop:576 length:198 start_codon:yes stop_codon:yes gene_type:complete
MKEQNNGEGVLTDSEVLTALMMSLNGGIKQESYEDYMARADKYYDNVAKGGSHQEPQENVKYTIK